jgi:hypothetical protein
VAVEKVHAGFREKGTQINRRQTAGGQDGSS